MEVTGKWVFDGRRAPRVGKLVSFSCQHKLICGAILEQSVRILKPHPASAGKSAMAD